MNRNAVISISLCFCLFGLLSSGAAQAVTHSVNPGQSIQAAIDAAVNGDAIEVTPGTYNEAIDFKGKAIRLYSTGGPEVTIIDGQNVRRGVQCINGEGSDTLLGGFTICNCRADQGAGMYNQNSRPTITDCIFSTNMAGAGGGMYNLQSSPTVTDCTFTSNETLEGLDGRSGDHPTSGGNGGDGAGMFNNQSNAVVTNCVFISNTTGMGGTGGDQANQWTTNVDAGYGGRGGCGGGVYNIDCSPKFIGCTFAANQTGKGAKGGIYSISKNSGDGGDGAGMYNSNASPILADCSFTYNVTGIGGTNAHWNGSAGNGGNGAGIFNIKSAFTITRCMFTENQTGNGGICTKDSMGGSGGKSGIGGHGAGVYNEDSSLTVSECTFQSNKTGDGGRAGSAYFSPFEDGWAGSSGGNGGSGAGIFGTNGNLTVMHCRFVENVTGNGASGGNGGDTTTGTGGDGGDGGFGGRGAAICNVACDVTTIIDCSFVSNIAGSGAIGGDGGWGLRGCGDDGDNGERGTSGIANYRSSPTITNCTFRNNQCPGVIHNLFSNPLITNCILWDVQSPEIINESSSLVVTSSTIKDGAGQSWFGPGCIDSDPMFADAEGRIPPYSPCAGAGDNDANGLSQWDIEGNPRIIGSRVDMGAYECTTLSVENITSGQSYEKIQSAIDEANPGDQIRVIPGHYREAIDFKGKAIRLFSSDGPETTTIDGSGNFHTVKCINGEGSGTVLDGFTITGGKADGGLDEDFNDGNYTGWTIFDEGNQYRPSAWSVVSGALMQTSNICTDPWDTPVFRGTYALWKYGFAWKNYEVTAKIRSEDNDIIGIMFRYKDKDNYYRINWGRDHYKYLSLGRMKNGVYTEFKRLSGAYAAYTWYTFNVRAVGPSLEIYIDGQLKLTAADPDTDYFDSGSIALFCWGNDQTFFDDISVRLTDSALLDTFGGGMYNQYSSPAVTNCIFLNNSALEFGGGMANIRSNPTVTNCVFRLNSVLSDTLSFGGGMFNHDGANPTVTNCTFTANTGPCGGGALCNWYGTGTTMTNCILWENNGPSDPANDEIMLYGTINLTSSVVQGASGQSWFGAGCLDTNPMFADVSRRLTAGSPCIDTGRNDAPGLPVTDILGYTRIADGNCDESPLPDMGAHEYNFADQGDFNYNCQVDLPDLLLLAESWMTHPGDPGWDRTRDIAVPKNKKIDLGELGILSRNWLD